MTKRKRNDVDLVDTSMLHAALALWFGVADVAHWFSTPQQPVKTVEIGSEIDARRCFSITDATACTEALCVFRGSSCLPMGQSRWWDIGAIINARPTGEMFRLVHKVGIVFKKLNGNTATSYICTMETVTRSNYCRIIVFPTGKVMGLPRGVQTSVLEVIRESLQHHRFVILCGHSMGASWAQMMALECCLQDEDFPIRNRIYVVGSAPFHWASMEKRDILNDRFRDQWLFVRNRCGNVVDARGTLSSSDHVMPLPLQDIEAESATNSTAFHAWTHYKKSIMNYISGRRNLKDGDEDSDSDEGDEDSDSDDTVAYVPITPTITLDKSMLEDRLQT